MKKQVTLRLGINVIDYFKKLSEETGVPYQSLINLYLQDCARSQKKTEVGIIAKISLQGKAVSLTAFGDVVEFVDL